MTKITSNRRKLRIHVLTYLGCLVIASFMWLFQSLNRNYTTTLKFPVKYLNLPKDKFIFSPLPKTCEAEVKASGIKLLLSYFRPIDEVLVIDYKTQKKSINASGKTEKLILSPQMLSFAFNTKLEVIRLKPDTIYIEYKKLYSKMVPIVHKVNMKFKQNYNLVGDIQLKPSHILITGDTAALHHIQYVETEDRTYTNLSADFSEPIQLKERLDQWRCNYALNEVLISAEVDRFTEKELELPIDALNVPIGYEVQLLPQLVKVNFSVAYKDFESIQAGLFKVVVDFRNRLDNSDVTLLTLENKPGNIYHLKLKPERVKYLFKKKK